MFPAQFSSPHLDNHFQVLHYSIPLSRCHIPGILFYDTSAASCGVYVMENEKCIGPLEGQGVS